MEDENIKLFTTSQAANKIGLTPSTFRKYLRYLEEDYHEIKRDSESNYRLFDAYNLAMIQRMIDYTKKPGWTVKEAAKQAVKDKEDVYKAVDTERIKGDTKNSTTLDTVDDEDITKLLRGLYDNQRELIENNNRLNEKIDGLYEFIKDLKSDNQRLHKMIDNKDVKQDEDSTILENDDDQTIIDDYISDDKEDLKEDNQPIPNDDHKESLTDYGDIKTNHNEPKKKKGFFKRLFGG